MKALNHIHTYIWYIYVKICTHILTKYTKTNTHSIFRPPEKERETEKEMNMKRQTQQSSMFKQA